MASPSSQRDSLTSLLSAQTALAERLHDLLTREYDLLTRVTAEAPDDLGRLLADKQALLAEIAEADRQLRETLAAQGLAADSTGLDALLARLDDSGGLARSWQRLAALLHECETQNLTNGGLVELSQRQVQFALDVLRGETTGTSTYGADGHTRSLGRSRSIAEA